MGGFYKCVILVFMLNGKQFFINIFKPRAITEDAKRREYILNILLFGFIVLSLVATIVSIVTFFRIDQKASSASPFFIFLFFIFFCFLYFLSKKGLAKISSYIFIAVLLVSGFNVSIYWGALLPQAVLMYVLGIVISGILISSRVSFLITLGIACFLIVLSALQAANIVPFEKKWYEHIYNVGDATTASVTLVLIALISWLSNREIDKALSRAKNSEKALEKQKDILEDEVEKRTHELKQVQLEKMMHLYRFAEFGRLASGLFHDLANPLNLVSLNLSKLASQSRLAESTQISKIEIPLQRAISGTDRLRDFIEAARDQMRYHGKTEHFFLANEINQALQMLNNKAKEAHVKISFICESDSKIYANPLKFATNLISNAIDAYEDEKSAKESVVEVKLQAANQMVKFSVQDWGKGVNKNFTNKIFEPFFTTKSHEKGIGLGLSISRDIVEKNFGGKIKVESNKQIGTIFTVELPIKAKNL